jgi:hypothetical protein
VQHNKKFVKSLGILALPNVHFYSGGPEIKVLESFPCGPSKVPILKKKLADYITNRLDADGNVIIVEEDGEVRGLRGILPWFAVIILCIMS